MQKACRFVFWTLGVLALFAEASAPSAGAQARPARIVSLNLCTDQILLEIVAKERIAALSFLAADPTMSASTEAAAGIALVHGDAEEVLALAPDLVLAGEYSTPATQSLLKRLGVPVVAVPLASTFEEIRGVIRQVAAATGEKERGEAVVQEFDERLAAARTLPDASRPTALAYQVNSLVSGPGSLVDEILTAAGFRNLAAERALGPGGRLPLETLVLSPPDLLVFANAPEDFRTVLGDNLRHPALDNVIRSHASFKLPMPLWLCGTPKTAIAVEKLASARWNLLAFGRAP